MKMKLVTTLLLLTIILAGCGISEDAKEQKANTEEPVSGLETAGDASDTEVDFSSVSSEEWQESATGHFKVMGYGSKEDIGLDLYLESPGVPLEMGPMGVTIEFVEVMDYKPSDGQKRIVFEGQDEVRVITAHMVFNNNSDLNILFNPDEATLITKSGESLTPLKYWSGTIDGNFTAGAKKAAGVSWATADIDSELSSVRIIIEPPVVKETNEPLSEPLEIDIEILPYY